MEQETWKDVIGYEGLYQVSSFGRIKSLARKQWNGKVWFWAEERILVQSFCKDYAKINLYKNHKSYTYRVHNLVAIAFITNPNNYPCVNHKDENKRNNRADNLEHCTYKYNSNYGTIKERRSDSSSIPIVQKTPDGETINVYKSRREAQRETGVHNVHISACVHGKQKSAGGYIWENI